MFQSFSVLAEIGTSTWSNNASQSSQVSSVQEESEGFPRIWNHTCKHVELYKYDQDPDWKFLPESTVFIRNLAIVNSFKAKDQNFTSFVSASPGDYFRIFLERLFFLLATKTAQSKFLEYGLVIERTQKPLSEFPALEKILLKRGLKEFACSYKVVRFKAMALASQRLEALRVYALEIPYADKRFVELVLFDPNHQILGTSAAKKHGTDFQSTKLLNYDLKNVIKQTSADGSLKLIYKMVSEWYHPKKKQANC